jgi:hypothetical protein
LAASDWEAGKRLVAEGLSWVGVSDIDHDRIE